MGLASFNFVVTANWSFARPNPPFADIKQGPDSRSWNLNRLDLNIFDEALVEQLTIEPGHGQLLDLKDLVNQVLQSFGFTRVLGLMLLPKGEGSICNVAPGGTTSDGLQWFFGSMDSSVNINPGGIFLVSDAVTATGGTAGGDATPVTPTDKTILISNLGTGTLTVDVVIPGSSE
jgi:hypothetical protein